MNAHQLQLYDVCAAKHHGNPQSVAANKSVKKDAYHRSILLFLEKAGDQGATSDELAKAFGVGINCVSGRLTELLAAGLIHRDETDTRPTRTGSRAAVCRIQKRA